MATRVELHVEATRGALEKQEQSLSRAINNSANPMIKKILEKDLAELRLAITTLTEIK